MNDLPDPRRYPRQGAAAPEAEALHALAERSLAAATAQDSDVADEAIAAMLDAMLARGDGEALAAALDSAPTLAIYRHLWRSLSRLARGGRGASDGLAVTLFAIPVVIIAVRSAGTATAAPLSGRRSRRRCARRRAARAQRAVRQPIVRARKCARDSRCDRRGAASRATCVKCARGGARSRWHSRRRRSR